METNFSSRPYSSDLLRLGAVACLALNGMAAAAAITRAQAGGAGSASASWHRQQGVEALAKHDFQNALMELRTAALENPTDALVYDDLGVALWESGKVEAAIPEFEKSVHLDAKSAAAHYHLALAYDRTDAPVKAIAEYQQALYRQTDLVPARYGLSEACLKVEDIDGSIRLLREIIREKPDFAEAHYNLGIQLWQKYRDTFGLRNEDDYHEAIEDLRTAIKLQPRQTNAYVALGKVLAGNQDVSGAVKILKAAVAIAPDSAECLYNYGLGLQQQQGRPDAAEAEARRAIEKDPQYAPAHRLLGLALRQRGALTEARNELTAAIKLDSGDIEAHHNLGVVLLSQGDFEGAIRELRETIRLDPFLSEARMNLVQSLQRSGQKDAAVLELAEAQKLEQQKASLTRTLAIMREADEDLNNKHFAPAEKLYRDALAISPDFPEAHFHLALALKGQGPARVSECARELKRVLALKENHSGAHYELGLLLDASGESIDAATQFISALSCAPGMIDARRMLARYALRRGDWAGAIEHSSVILAWVPGDAESERWAGHALVQERDWAEAVPALRAAISANDRFPQVHRDLAAALKAQGQLGESRRQLEIASKLQSAGQVHE
jgi:tetratricopeptide (TPR) repeat protein